MSRTADLVVARDAELDGRHEIAEQLWDVDCEWKRLTARPYINKYGPRIATPWQARDWLSTAWTEWDATWRRAFDIPRSAAEFRDMCREIGLTPPGHDWDVG